MKILFIGPQGSGKSTQAKLLSEYLNIPFVSTGDVFRDISKEDTEYGRVVKGFLDAGKLVSDDVVSKLVRQTLSHPEYQNGFILDGYPRTFNQVTYFDPGFDKVFYLELDDETAKKRLLERAREDDTDDLIAERLKIYHQLTDPIIDYYQKAGVFKTIDANLSIEEIQQEIRGSING